MHLSFWEHDAAPDADFIVVGAGLIGLQTALELRALAPDARIAVLERGVLPYGASTRNAGFACFGSLTEILHDFDTMGEDAALAVVEQRWRGLARLRARVGEAALGFEPHGGYELLSTAQLPALERMDEANARLRPLFGRDVFQLDAAMRAASGFGPQVAALVANPLEGQLHSGRMMRALSRLAVDAGIALYGGVTVRSLHEGAAGVELHAGSAADPRELRFRAARVALCTNGLLGELAPACAVRPGRGQVLVTAPVAGLRWRGTFHMDEGYWYFRNIGDRVLLGGGRHLDFAGEETSAMGLSAVIQQAQERLLRETILPGSKVAIEHRWSGIMGFSADKQPIVRAVSPRVAIGFGCNGMGVALGADIAARTAALLHGC
ncbi:MAG TPA: FAD-dependent oxidoreductase [Noviherbaspirillum sp.]|nr:FAD-dependent oxidoreductase [Noviherbaspirillum sp.]